MICIFAPGSVKTLCGGKVTNHVGYFEGRVDCPACLIRQDAMFAREYKQTVWSICYNEHAYRARKLEDINIRIWFRKATYINKFVGWDTATIRGAIKLGKFGCADMGAKE